MRYEHKQKQEASATYQDDKSLLKVSQHELNMTGNQVFEHKIVEEMGWKGFPQHILSLLIIELLLDLW